MMIIQREVLQREKKNDSRIHNAWDIAGRSSGMWTVPE